MFLDEKGEKISKSKGNGLSLEEWLRYGSEESLAFYIYREPKQRQEPAHRRHSRARSTNIGSSASKYREQPLDQKLGNPVHHIHGGKVPAEPLPRDLRPAAQSRRACSAPRRRPEHCRNIVEQLPAGELDRTVRIWTS